MRLGLEDRVCGLGVYLIRNKCFQEFEAIVSVHAMGAGQLSQCIQFVIVDQEEGKQAVAEFTTIPACLN